MAMFLGNCSYRYNVNASYNSSALKGGIARFGNDGGLTCGNTAGFVCGSLTSENWCGSFSSTPLRTLFNGSTYYILTKYLTYPSSAGGSHTLTQSSTITTEDGRTLTMSCDLFQNNAWTSVGSVFSRTMLYGACYHYQVRCTNSYINNTSVLGTTRAPWTLDCQPCV